MREIGTTVLGLLVVDDEKDPVGLLLVPNGIVPLSERDDASLRDAARAWRPAPRSSRRLSSAPVTPVTPVTPP